jgi:hypothetical protein
MVCTMHEILDKEGTNYGTLRSGGPLVLPLTACPCWCAAVFLVETLGAAHVPLKHLKALVFVRPTRKNIAILQEELREPRYSEYSLCALWCIASLLSVCGGRGSTSRDRSGRRLFEHVIVNDGLGDAVCTRARGRVQCCEAGPRVLRGLLRHQFRAVQCGGCQ